MLLTGKKKIIEIDGIDQLLPFSSTGIASGKIVPDYKLKSGTVNVLDIEAWILRQEFS
jgi:hypothetical protein